MTVKEMKELRAKYYPFVTLNKAIHVDDEGYDPSKVTISYKNIIVGSELVTQEFVENYIKMIKERYNW